jgi:hypothetical protein
MCQLRPPPVRFGRTGMRARAQRLTYTRGGRMTLGREGNRSVQNSQASDVGSIPIARSINPDDSVDLTRLSSLNWTKNRLVLDGSWTVLKSIGRGYFAIELEPMVPAVFPRNTLAALGQAWPQSRRRCPCCAPRMNVLGKTPYGCVAPGHRRD